jgi:hypothetical protein
MGSSRLPSVAARAAAVVSLLSALSACASSGAARSATPGAEPEVVAERGPGVQIWTTNEPYSGDRVRTSFRLADDAYVIVVNVGRDGYANVIFPESPDDDGFMRGGRTYRLPAFFPGFSRGFRSDYGRLYSATSAYDDVYDRYTGYVFVIASWRPMHFQIGEALGLWDDYRLATHEERLEPYTVMHRFADQLVAGKSRDYTARFARYAAFARGVGRAGSLASCAGYGSILGDFPHWAFAAFSRSWNPVYGIGYHGLGPSQCGFGFGITLIGFRPPLGPIATPPVRPTPVPDSGDTASKPRYPRQPRPPVVASDSGERKSPPRGRRAEVAMEEEPTIDVTKATRDLARRRDREADRMRRGVRSERGYEEADGWRRAQRARDSERSDGRDLDRSERAHARERTPVDHDSRAQRDDSRREPRSEPRREQPSRSEPRSEPRQEARPQPTPRSDPPPRPEASPKTQPRSERPPKPERQ